MRTSTSIALFLLSLAACGDSGEGNAENADKCKEPAFVEGVSRDWAPCGCSWDSPWWTQCEATDDYLCLDTIKGGTCAAFNCSDANPCPPYEGRETVCSPALDYCYIPCGPGCPQGMECSKLWGRDDGACIHSFPP